MRPSQAASSRNERGIVLAIVLVMIFALVTAVFSFQRRAIIDTTIATNRLEAAEADALAKGGLRAQQYAQTRASNNAHNPYLFCPARVPRPAAFGDSLATQQAPLCAIPEENAIPTLPYSIRTQIGRRQRRPPSST